MNKLRNKIIIMAVLLVVLLSMTTGIFAADESLEYTLNGDGTANITKCNSSVAGEFVIPSQIDGYTVTTIGTGAFSECSSITSITIPASVKKIGMDAFLECNNLESVHVEDIDTWLNIEFENTYSNPLYVESAKLYVDGTLLTSLAVPDGVTEIKKYAFKGCSDLTSVNLPNSITSIGSEAFAYCSGLTEFIFPESITSINHASFDMCSNLSRFIVLGDITSTTDGAFSTMPTNTHTPAVIYGRRGAEILQSFAEESGYQFVFLDCTAEEPIEFTPDKTNYKVGDDNDLIGQEAKVSYYDAYGHYTTMVNVTASMISGFDTKTAGTKTVTITIDGVSTSFNISVDEDQTSVPEVQTKPIDINTTDVKIKLDPHTRAYDGKSVEPKATITGIDGNYSVTYDYSETVKHGTHTVTLTFSGDYYGTITETYWILRAPVSAFQQQVSLSQNSFYYDGEAKTPTVTIPGLTEGIDFTVSYQNNVNTGTATIKITGINHFTDSFTTTFTIESCNHVWNTGSVIKEPTCIDAGLLKKTCQQCGVAQEESIGTVSHTEIILSGKAATCTKTGLTAGKKCSVCNTITVKQKRVAKKGHTLKTLKAKKATCTKTGLTAGKKCSVCNTITVKQKKVAKKGHTLKTLKAKKATCTKTGLTKGKQCKTCNKIIVAQKKTKKLAHTVATTKITKATLKKNGSIKKRCSCGKRISNKTIYKVKTIKLSKRNYVFDGKTKNPVVVVKDSQGKKLKVKKDYTIVKPKNRTSTGTYVYKIKMKGKYSGTKKLKMTIRLKKPNETKITAISTQNRTVSLSWNPAASATGYYIWAKAGINGEFKKIDTVDDKDITYYYHIGLKKGEAYYYQVQPFASDYETTLEADPSSFVAIVAK